MDAATSLVGTQLGSTLLAIGGMQWLKKAKWFPLLKDGQRELNRLWSIVIAGGIALGIHVTFTGSSAEGWSFVGSIPSVWVMLTALFHWAAQYIYQETGYSILTAAQSLAGILAHLQTVAPQIAPTAAPKPVEESAPLLGVEGKS